MKGKNPVFVSLYYFYSSLANDFHWNIFSYLRGIIWYFRDLTRLMKSKGLSNIGEIRLVPFLSDKTEYTKVEPIYFFQDLWASQKILKDKPKVHYDIASSYKTIGILSRFVPCVFVDIRPPDVKVDNLKFMKGSVLNLPFKKGSINSLSSLCVIEHIGLGRYGDEIDMQGSEKAARELQRVILRNGNLYLSVPVDEENRIYFNAHRAFTRKCLLSLFNQCRLVDESYVYGKKLFKKYDRNKGFGTGLFHFKKM